MWAAVLFVPLLVVVPLGEAAAQSLPRAQFGTIGGQRLLTVSEADSTVSATVELSAPAPAGGLTVSYSVGGSNYRSAAANRDYVAGVDDATSGVDFEALSGSVTVPANETSATISITLTDDAVVEGAELLLLELTADSTYTLGAGDAQYLALIVVDDDVPAPVVVAADWGLVPSGLSDGDRFRLLFVSSTKRDASSTDVGVYNTHVQGRAAAGHADIRAHSSLFRALVSTQGEDAADNTHMYGTGAPVYWLGGAKVADDYADFWDNDWDSVASVDESGTDIDTTTSDNFLNANGSGDIDFANAIWSGTRRGESGRGYNRRLGTDDAGATFLGTSGTGRLFPSAKPLDIVVHDRPGKSTSHYVMGVSPLFVVGTPSSDVGVSFGVGSGSVGEGGSATFEANLLGGAVAPAGGLVLPISVNAAPAVSSDASSADYGSVPSSITIAAGASMGSASLSITDDAVDELRERVRFGVGTLPDGYVVSGGALDAASSRVTVLDGDATVVSLSGGGSVTEGDASSSASVTVSLSRALAADPLNSGNAESLSVPLALSESGAMRGSHYTVSCPSPLPSGVSCAGLSSGTPTVTFAGSASAASSVVVTFSGGSTVDSDTANGSVGVALGTLSASNMDGGAAAHATQSSVSVTVADSTPPAVKPTLTVASDGAVVEGADASFTVTASPAPAGALSVRYSVTKILGLVDASELGSHTVSLDLSGGTAKITVPTVDDSTVEFDGSVSVSLDAQSQYTVGSPGSAEVAISDNDPQLTIASDGDVTEGSNASFTLSASGSPQAAVTVHYTVAATGGYVDSADLGAKQVTLSGSSRKITVPTVGDSVEETDGSVTVALAAASNKTDYSLGSTSSASAAVADDDAALPVVSVTGGAGVTEGTAASFTVTVSPAPTGTDTVTVHYTVSQSGSFVASGDRGAKQVQVGSSGSASVSVPTEADSADETDGSVTVTVDSNAAYSVSGSAGSASVDVSDDDDPALPTVSVTGGASVTEGTAAGFTVTVSPAPSGSDTVTVHYTVTQSGSFVTAANRGAKQVSVGSSGSASVSVPTEADSADEANGSVTVTVDSNAAYTVSGSAGSASVGVADDDGTLPVLSLEPGSVTTEGSSAYFSVIAKPSVSGTLSVSYTVTQDGAFVASGDLGSQSLSASGGFTGFAVPTVGDSTDETSGSVTVTLDAGSGYTVDADASSSTVLVLDDDGAVEVTVAADLDEVDEGADAHVLVYVRPKPTAPVEIPLTLTLGTAEAGDVGSVGSASFAKGDLTQRVTVATNADADADDDTFTVGIGSPLPAGYAAGAHSTAAFTVVDTGTTVTADPELSVTAGAAVAEGAAASFTVTASPAPSGSLTVAYSVSQTGSFVSAANRGAQSATLDLSGGTATVTVPTEADSADEPNGTVTVTLSAGTGYTVSGTAGSATVDVSDDDLPQPTVSVTGGAAVTEGAAAGFTVSVSPAPTGTVTVQYTVTQSGSYVSAANRGAKQVQVGSSGTASVSVPTEGDSADETDGSVTVTVNADAAYAVHSSNGAATVTVRDDDADPSQPQLTLARTAASVTEGAAAGFAVTASPAPSGTLTVRYHISQSGDWLTGTTGTTSASLDLSGGTATIEVATDDDSADETDGSVTVTLLTGSGYSVGSPGSQTVAVTDNDAGTTTTVDPGSNGGGGGGSPGPAPQPRAAAADERERSDTVVVLADGWSPPDIGAAAAYAARTPHAVVLYTDTHRLSASTREYLDDALPARIVIVGGTAAVTDATARTARRAAGLGADGVERISGDDRAHTAAQTARRALGSPAAISGPVTLVIANGWSPPDIGAAAALAARTPRSAVLYTRTGTLPDTAAAVIADYRPARIVIIGGTAAVAPATADAIRDIVPAADLHRIAGTDRHHTAAHTARQALGDPDRTPAGGVTLVIANGHSPPDIGAAAALTARTPRSAVLYTETGTLPAATQAVIADHQPTNIIIIGGTTAITPDTEQAIRTAAPAARITRITGTDRTHTAANTARQALPDN